MEILRNGKKGKYKILYALPMFYSTDTNTIFFCGAKKYIMLVLS